MKCINNTGLRLFVIYIGAAAATENSFGPSRRITPHDHKSHNARLTYTGLNNVAPSTSDAKKWSLSASASCKTRK